MPLLLGHVKFRVEVRLISEAHRAVHRIRGFVAWYSRGLNGGSMLRRSVNRAPDAAEFEEIVNTFFDQGHVS